MKPIASTLFLGRSFLLLVVALVFLLGVQNMPAWAQAANTGTVSGVVTDPQDAVISGAAVTLTSKGIGFTQKTTTQADGHYLFVNVPPGIYDLTVAMPGFDTAKVSSQQVRIGLTVTVNVKLKVGTTT